MAYYYGWKPYVPVAQRQASARRKMDALRKKGIDIQPVEIEGRKIAKTFWGEAWCKHMDAQGDYANRLPRGRTYVRNGSVCHLSIAKGKITAMVSGSELYNVTIAIGLLPADKWDRVKQQCSGQIGSLLELLKGRISNSVMKVVTDPREGLFPLPKEIKLNCDCPDYATMCKHAAAVLYGVAARLDSQPELLFLLRGVNHLDLVTASAEEAVSQATTRGGSGRRVVADDLSDVFGIELDAGEDPSPAEATPSEDAESPASAARKKRSRASSSQRAKRKKKRTAKKSTAKKSDTTQDLQPTASQKKTAKKKTAKKKAAKVSTSKKKAPKKKTTSRQSTRKTTASKKPAEAAAAPEPATANSKAKRKNSGTKTKRKPVATASPKRKSAKKKSR